jgi:hypothetical protein
MANRIAVDQRPASRMDGAGQRTSNGQFGMQPDGPPDGAEGQDGGVAATAVGETKQVAAKAVDAGAQVATVSATIGRDVALAASELGRHLAEVARADVKDLVAIAGTEFGQLAHGVSEHGQGLLDDTKDQLRGQVEAQARKLAAMLRRLGDEAEALADGRPVEPGPLTDSLRQLAARVDEIGAEIDQQGVEGLVKDFERLARRRPAMVVVGAGVLGAAAGRILRAAASATPVSPRDGDSNDPIRSGRVALGPGARRLSSASATGGA